MDLDIFFVDSLWNTTVQAQQPSRLFEQPAMTHHFMNISLKQFYSY
jgi:hypothetical protein